MKVHKFKVYTRAFNETNIIYFVASVLEQSVQHVKASLVPNVRPIVASSMCILQSKLTSYLNIIAALLQYNIKALRCFISWIIASCYLSVFPFSNLVNAFKRKLHIYR